MLIGTAGHIDHGKTTLIRALTGVDTDRLPEEKRRGISIDLGFAYLSADDEVLGFVDVPGHERFVPTMLAGATGIDFALLVVAADDGPMPQTREHLDILRLLGIACGAVALTKIDKASADQRAQAEAALDALLAGTPFATAPRFPVAALTGEGIKALRQCLLDAARAASPAAPQPLFRLAVDRSFALAGAGTVVTGTVHAGQVAVGDQLRVVRSTGASHAVRVRSLHANNRPAPVAGRGMRCALNLVGIGHQDVARGDWVVSEALAATAAGERRGYLDVELEVLAETLADSASLLRAGATLHVHHGAGHTMGRLVPLAPLAPLAPDGGLWQLVTPQPLLACHGDLLILRDPSAQRTLAGARVLDPAGPARHRASAERLRQLAALQLADPSARLAALLAATPLGVDLTAFGLAANVARSAPPGALVLTPAAGEARAFAPEHYAALAGRVEAALADYHARHPDELGLERERLRRMLLPQLEARSFQALLAAWLTEGRLAQTGSAWHLPSHRVELGPAEQALAERLLPQLLASPYDPPWVRDLAAREALEEGPLRGVLRKLAAQGEVFQVVRDLFYHRQAVAALVAIVRELADPQVKAAAFRDRTGLGRKRAIQILEFFDRVGFTRRVGSGQAQAHVIRGEPPTA